MLSRQDLNKLDQAGWLLLEGLIPTPELPQWLTAFEKADQTLQHRERKRGGTRHLDLKQDTSWQTLLDHVQVRAALQHLLGHDCYLHDFHGRDPQPGFGEQGLHCDALPRQPGEPCQVATVLWLLDAYTSSNGATRLVPGSHLLYSPLPKKLSQPQSHHPEEITVTGPAGSALIFSGHLWHSGTRNQSKASRRVLQCIYHRQFGTNYS
jgi:ectoine hydroxylase-related dioxygenase (phytanoyl-CoA dioxygenase family)